MAAKRRNKEPAADHIGSLTPDSRNARRHNPRNVGLIVDSLHSVGAGRSILIDEDNVILAGNATVEAAGEAGITKLRIIETNGDEIIAVRRRGLTKTQKTRMALVDNHAAELSDWDESNLKLLEPAEFEGIFSEDELQELIGVEKKKTKDLGDVGDLAFRIVITCKNEEEQATLLEELETKGIDCRALMS